MDKAHLGMDGLTEDAVLKEARKGKDEKEISGRLCEANYYIGEQRLFKGDRKGAEESFNASMDTNMIWFSEYSFSKAMLERMKQGKE